MWLSNMWTGRKHDNRRLPVVIGGGNKSQTGRTLNYVGEPDADRKMCSVFLSLMGRRDIKLDHFGGSDTRMADVQIPMF